MSTTALPAKDRGQDFFKKRQFNDITEVLVGKQVSPGKKKLKFLSACHHQNNHFLDSQECNNAVTPKRGVWQEYRTVKLFYWCNITWLRKAGNLAEFLLSRILETSSNTSEGTAEFLEDSMRGSLDQRRKLNKKTCRTQ